MEIALATLADHANTTGDGKLNIIGLFDALHVRDVPATHASMHLVLRIRVEPSELDRQHELEIRCNDDDGEELFKVKGAFSVTGLPWRASTVPHVVGINNLPFQKYGIHTFSILINEQVMQTLELEVVKVEPQARQKGAGE